jgi:hypothetical protein
MQWYNGFSPEQRLLKARAMNLALATGELATPTGPCELCGDPDVPVEFHDEDYSEPFRWEAPAAYRICRRCHRRLHLRFGNPLAWQTFLAHVRRGGYARDLLNPVICAELVKYQRRSLIRDCPITSNSGAHEAGRKMEVARVLGRPLDYTRTTSAGSTLRRRRLKAAESA